MQSRHISLNPLIKYALTFVLYFFGFMLIGLALWTSRYFGYVTFDQAYSTFYFGMDGLFVADSIYIKRFLTWCVLWPAIISLICLYFSKWRFAPTILIAVGLCLVFFQFSGPAYIKSLGKSKVDIYSENYIDPRDVVITKKKNNSEKSLVLIYVESLETTYSNEKIFGHDLLAPLNQFKTKSGVSFSQYTQLPGTGFTMAGIVSTQCGIPLKELTILDGNRLGQNIKRFLPGAVCMSDILHHFGYRNIFMNGSSLLFAGKYKFLQDHHYDEMYGKEQWLSMGLSSVSMSDWGLSDHDLFEQAKIKLEQLMGKKQFFNLTILTVDTHGYGGRLNSYCKQRGYRNFTGVVECTAAETADFIKYIENKGWMNRVNVVVIGDHLAMQNAVHAQLNQASNRYIYNLFISKNPIHKCNDLIGEFGLFPSLLKLSGFHVSGNRLGLGWGLVGYCHHHPRPPGYIEQLIANADNSSKLYTRLWLNDISTKKA